MNAAKRYISFFCGAGVGAIADIQPALVGRTHPCSPAYAFRSNRGYRSLALTHRASSPLTPAPAPPTFGSEEN